MKCSQCAADLPDSATSCYRCGAPVSLAAPANTSLRTFSYLPADAPPWPNHVPQQLARSTIEEPSLPTTAPRKRSGSAKILTAVAAILLIPLLGSALTFAAISARNIIAPPAKATGQQQVNTTLPKATPTVQTSTTLPNPTGFKQVSVKEVNLSFSHPADWQIDPPQSGNNFTNLAVYPQQQLGIYIAIYRYSESFSATIKQPDDVNDAILSNISQAQGISNVQQLQSSNRTIAGAQWRQQDVKFMATQTSSQTNTEVYAVLMTVQHEKSYYNIQVVTPDVVHDEAMKKYIDPILSSVKFLS